MFLNTKEYSSFWLNGKQYSKGFLNGKQIFGDVYDASTLALISAANSKGYALPTNLTPLDNFIKNLKTISAGAFWNSRDTIHLSSVIGNSETHHGLRKLNLKNPAGQERVFYGGLSLNSYGGIQGNGTNAYIDHVTPVNSYTNYKQDDAGIIVVKSLDSMGIIVAGSNTNSLSIIVRGNVSGNVRLNTINTTGSFDNSGVGTIGLSRNLATMQVLYNKESYLNQNATSSVIPSNAVINEFRNSANGNTYYLVDSLITLVGASFTQAELNLFRTYFNQYLVESGFTAIA